MAFLDTIKADQLAARKAGDKVKASLLTTLIGEATFISTEEHKKGLTEVTDEKVIGTVKKFLKNAQQTREALAGSGDARLVIVEEEVAILVAYLPQQLTEAQLRDVIVRFKEANAGAKVGDLMSFLKTEYAGLYNGKDAAVLFNKT